MESFPVRLADVTDDMVDGSRNAEGHWICELFQLRWGGLGNKRTASGRRVGLQTKQRHLGVRSCDFPRP
jgi:hypothetical protein